MSLLETLQGDYKQAFRDKNTLAKDVLSIVLSIIQNRAIESHKPLTDTEIQQILLKEQKAIKETLSYLAKTDKAQAIADEEAKIELLAGYLPALFSEDKVKSLVDEAIKTLDVQDIGKERGKLIGYMLQKYP